MIDQLLPFALVSRANPVFRFDLRKNRWPRSKSDLARYSRNVILGCVVLFGVAWCIVLGNQGRYGLSSSETSLIGWLIVLATAGSLLASDFYCAVVTVNSLNRQVTSGEWDLVRLTGQHEEDIFKAKQAVAQIRAWRLMSVETAIRAVGAEVLLLSIAYSWLSNSYTRHDWMNVFLLLAASALMAFYVIEPFWKMRAVVALGMAISAQVHNLTFAVFGVLGAVFAMRLLQGMIFAVLFFLMVQIARSVHSNVAAACLVAAFVASLGFSMWLLYRIMTRMATRQAFKKLFQTD